MATNNSVNSIYLPLAGGTMTGNLILNADPTTALQAVTKQYADNIAGGGDYKNATVAATTAALTVTYSNGTAGVGATLTNAGAQAAFSIDGQSPTVNQRVLIKNQASAFQNGIYSVTTVGDGSHNWVLTRTTDYNNVTEIVPGNLVPVENGTVNANTLWLQTATVVTIGTDAITFQQFSSAPIALPVTLANGGTNANLTASNGGIFYSTASAGAILAGTATARQMLQSGASTTPAWSTATWPATTTVSQILYSSSANVVGGITTANSAVLVTNSTGVPAFSGTMTNGQLIIGNTSGTPTAATITAGTGITVTNGTGTITIASSAGTSGLTWIASATASGSATINFNNDLSATYDNYLVLIEDFMPATNSTIPEMQIGTTSTPTYQISGYQNSGAGGVTTYFVMALNGTTMNNASGGAGCFQSLINNVNNSSDSKTSMTLGTYFNNGSTYTSVFVSGAWGTATVLTSVRFLMSSGNITSGTFKLYGYQN